jgi:DNA-binding transcriptional LysR family regulator
LAVVEYGGFTQAAKHLHISQPALSVAIQELEKDVGTQLLHRQGKAVRLTEAGQIAYDSACRIRNEQRAMQLQLREHASGQPHMLRLGLLDTIASLLFASPQSVLPAHLAVMVDNSDRLLHEMSFGRIDAAIVAASPSESTKSLQARRLRDERFVFVANAAVAAQTDPRHIANWLAFNPASHTYAQFVRDFERQGMVVLPTFYSTSMDLIRSMALAGKGVGLLPRYFVADELAKGNLAMLDTPVFARNLWYVQPAGQAEPKAIQQLIQAMELLM